MATFKINGKNFATQDGTGAATVHSDVVFPSGHVVQVQSTNWSDSNLNTEESHYTNLIARLKEISKTIFLLEKSIFR